MQLEMLSHRQIAKSFTANVGKRDMRESTWKPLVVKLKFQAYLKLFVPIGNTHSSRTLLTPQRRHTTLAPTHTDSHPTLFRSSEAVVAAKYMNNNDDPSEAEGGGKTKRKAKWSRKTLARFTRITNG